MPQQCNYSGQSARRYSPLALIDPLGGESFLGLFHGFADTKEVFVVEGVDGLGLVEKASLRYQPRLNSSWVFSGILARSASISLPKGGIRVSKYSWTWTMSAFALPGSSCWEWEPDLQVSLTSRAW